MSSKFLPHRARISGELDSKKDSHTKKFKQRPQILVMQSFRELCDSRLSSCAFDITISLSQKRGKNQKGILDKGVIPPFSRNPKCLHLVQTYWENKSTEWLFELICI